MKKTVTLLEEVRRNLLDYCGALCQTDRPKGLRVDLFDARHWEAGTTLDSYEPATVQGGVKMVTKDVEYIMRHPYSYIEEIAERQVWLAANSTGIY